MVWKNPPKEEMKRILEGAKTIAVVGLSNNPERTSYQVTKNMQQNGYQIIPVNPAVDMVLGEKSVDSLMDIKEKVDIINVFRRPEFLPGIARQATQTDCNVFWAQQGVANEEAWQYLNNHSFTVIMDTCIKVAHAVLVKK